MNVLHVVGVPEHDALVDHVQFSLARHVVDDVYELQLCGVPVQVALPPDDHVQFTLPLHSVEVV